MKAQAMVAYLRDVKVVAARYGTAIDTSLRIIESYEEGDARWALTIHTELSGEPAFRFWHEIEELPSMPDDEAFVVWVDWTTKREAKEIG